MSDPIEPKPVIDLAVEKTANVQTAEAQACGDQVEILGDMPSFQ